MAWISIPFHDDSHVGKVVIAAGVFLVIGIGSYSLYHLMRRKNKISITADTGTDGIKTDGLVECIDQLNQAIGNLSHIKLDHHKNDGENDEKSQQLILCIDRLADQVHQLRFSLQSLQATNDVNSNRRDSFTSLASSQSSDNFYDTTLEDDDAYNSGIERFLSCESLESFPYRQSKQETIINLDELLKSVDQLHDNYNVKSRRKALDKLKNIYINYQQNVQVLWRYSRAHLDLLDYVSENDAKSLTYSAHDIAKQAISVDDNCSQAHKWYGLSLGAIISYEGNKKKIELGFEFKLEMDKALELNPNDYEVIGYIGRWCYECASLSWIEKKGAQMLYGSIPSATVSEAKDYLVKADGIQPGYSKNNRLYIAKCYLYERDYKNARHWLMQAQEVDTITKQDKEAEKEIAKLLLQC